MIPPLAPGQNEENENMVKWKNTFNMRQVTLLNLAASNLTLRASNQIAFNRMRNGCISSSTKSLDILRKNLQSAINRDIDTVIKKYLEKFFQPAIENIRNNLGRDSINDDHVKEVCRQMLEEAKQIYSYSTESRDSSPYECSDSETGSLGLTISRSPAFRKRKESDTDSENSQSALQKRSKYRNVAINGTVGNSASPNRSVLKFEGPKWNPERIKSTTLFIMGARANKVLGYGQTRGRLYVRHPDLMRYSGDQEDKDWLSRHNLLPANGGKAYLMVLDDIKELSRLDEYKNSPNLLPNELKGFEVPVFMLNKIRTFMEQVRTDSNKITTVNQITNFDLYDFQACHSMTPPSTTTLDSGPSTPSDTLQHALDNTTTSKNTELNLYINAPEISPGSNSYLTQSPISNTLLGNSGQNVSFASNDLRQSLKQNNLGNVQHTALSAFLSGQMSSDNSQDDSEF